MKNVSLLILALLLFSCNQEDDIPTPIDQVDQVSQEIETIPMSNRSFEDGYGTSPDHWWQRVDDYTLTWTDDCAFSGDKSVSISTKKGQPDFCYWAQTFTEFETGKGLKLNVKVKTDAIKGNGCSLVIRGDNTLSPEGLAEYFATTQNVQFIGGTQDWTTYELVAPEAIGKNIKSISIYLLYFAETTGTVYFDEVVVEADDSDK